MHRLAGGRQLADRSHVRAETLYFMLIEFFDQLPTRMDVARNTQALITRH